MRALLIALLLLLALFPAALAEEFSLEDVSVAIDELKAREDFPPDEELPGMLSSLFGDENLNVHIERAAGEEVVVNIITEDKKLKDIALGQSSTPTMNVYVLEDTLVTISESDEPAPALIAAINSGEIRYEAVGITRKIKLGIFSVVAKIAGIFF